MITFDFKNKITNPYSQMLKFYKRALKENQKYIEAACLSTVSNSNKPYSRFVNIKYFNDNRIIFFSNYNSQKANHINNNNNVAINFFWDCINTQIRIEGKIYKLSTKQSDLHWGKRDDKKNALAISSDQSKKAISYSHVRKKYYDIYKNFDLSVRPKYWGGYYIRPTYFEFWEGNKNRINRRKAFKKQNNKWVSFFLQP
tara:strand:+ start:893 stop:1489 length:597 start_codon:yes stop_codon:yes gene_type:complete